MMILKIRKQLGTLDDDSAKETETFEQQQFYERSNIIHPSLKFVLFW